MVEVPAKPLQPSPTVKTCVLPPCCTASAALSVYSIYSSPLVQVIWDFPALRHGQLVSLLLLGSSLDGWGRPDVTFSPDFFDF